MIWDWRYLRHPIILARYLYREKFLWWVAWKLPKRVALFAFVRVYAVLGYCGPDYDAAYKAFEARGK